MVAGCTKPEIAKRLRPSAATATAACYSYNKLSAEGTLKVNLDAYLNDHRFSDAVAKGNSVLASVCDQGKVNWTCSVGYLGVSQFYDGGFTCDGDVYNALGVPLLE